MGTEGVIHNNKWFDRDLIYNRISSQHTSVAINKSLRLLLFAYNILDPDSVEILIKQMILPNIITRWSVFTINIHLLDLFSETTDPLYGHDPSNISKYDVDCRPD